MAIKSFDSANVFRFIESDLRCLSTRIKCTKSSKSALKSSHSLMTSNIGYFFLSCVCWKWCAAFMLTQCLAAIFFWKTFRWIYKVDSIDGEKPPHWQPCTISLKVAICEQDMSVKSSWAMWCLSWGWTWLLHMHQSQNHMATAVYDRGFTKRYLSIHVG